jgi:hypothetical protein
MDSKSMLTYGAEVLAIAVVLYLFASPGGYLKTIVVGGSYSEYLQPLLLAVLAVLVCWSFGKMM